MSRLLNQSDVTTASKIEHQKSGVWYWDTISNLIALAISSLPSLYAPRYTTSRVSPASGDTITLSGVETFLLITPNPLLSSITLSLILPDSTIEATDGQRIKVHTTVTISTLTINANGASTSGVPNSLTATNVFTIRYESQTNTWYRDS